MAETRRGLTGSTRAAETAKLTELLAKDAKRSKRWACSKREDGSAQVYAPSMGLCRIVVPVAETTPGDGELIVALRNAAAGLLEDRERLQKLDALYDEAEDLEDVSTGGERTHQFISDVLALLRPSGATSEQRG